MAKKSKPRGLLDLPVDVLCPHCGGANSAPLKWFEYRSPDLLCQKCHHTFTLSQESADRHVRDHSNRIEGIRRRFESS